MKPTLIRSPSVVTPTGYSPSGHRAEYWIRMSPATNCRRKPMPSVQVVESEEPPGHGADAGRVALGGHADRILAGGPQGERLEQDVAGDDLQEEADAERPEQGGGGRRKSHARVLVVGPARIIPGP